MHMKGVSLCSLSTRSQLDSTHVGTCTMMCCILYTRELGEY